MTKGWQAPIKSTMLIAINKKCVYATPLFLLRKDLRLSKKPHPNPPPEGEGNQFIKPIRFQKPYRFSSMLRNGKIAAEIC